MMATRRWMGIHGEIRRAHVVRLLCRARRHIVCGLFVLMGAIGRDGDSFVYILVFLHVLK